MPELPEPTIKFKMIFEELSFTLDLLNDLRILTPTASKQQRAINAITKAHIALLKEIMQIYVSVYDLEQSEPNIEKDSV